MEELSSYIFVQQIIQFHIKWLVCYFYLMLFNKFQFLETQNFFHTCETFLNEISSMGYPDIRKCTAQRLLLNPAIAEVVHVTPLETDGEAAKCCSTNTDSRVEFDEHNILAVSKTNISRNEERAEEVLEDLEKFAGANSYNDHKFVSKGRVSYSARYDNGTGYKSHEFQSSGSLVQQRGFSSSEPSLAKFVECENSFEFDVELSSKKSLKTVSRNSVRFENDGTSEVTLQNISRISSVKSSAESVNREVVSKRRAKFEEIYSGTSIKSLTSANLSGAISTTHTEERASEKGKVGRSLSVKSCNFVTVCSKSSESSDLSSELREEDVISSGTRADESTDQNQSNFEEKHETDTHEEQSGRRSPAEYTLEEDTLTIRRKPTKESIFEKVKYSSKVPPSFTKLVINSERKKAPSQDQAQVISCPPQYCNYGVCYKEPRILNYCDRTALPSCTNQIKCYCPCNCQNSTLQNRYACCCYNDIKTFTEDIDNKRKNTKLIYSSCPFSSLNFPK